VRDALRAENINVSVMDADSARLDYDARGLTQAVRSSVHYYNDESEIDRLVAAVA
jgi:cysteine desulfurase / selenocysteine lyase